MKTDTDICGATQEEWNALSETLGLTGDMLPVVSNHRAVISSRSSVERLGKTPTRYNKASQVTGITGWSTRITTKQEIQQWQANKDYGICLQTRNIKALDVDVPNTVKADKIKKFIFTTLDRIFPVRNRGNTGKFLIPIALEGVYGKRTVEVEGGIIEFLATGQQFIASGTHEDGSRYMWEPKIPDIEAIPSISGEIFEKLWNALCETFGIAEPTRKRAPNGKGGFGDQSGVEDDISAFLFIEGHEIGRGSKGQVFIECPFSDGHSTQDAATSTAYFPKGCNGYEQGKFVCLHASCADRSDDDFMDAYDLRTMNFDVIPVDDVRLETPPWERLANGKVTATLSNIGMYFDREDLCDLRPRFDTFLDSIIFADRSNRYTEIQDDVMVRIRRSLERDFNFAEIGKEKMRDAVLLSAKEKKVDSAIEWLNAQQWDGIERIETFYSVYAGCEDTPYTRSVGLYTWTALAGRVLVPGIQADQVPVLVGREGMKKTSLVSSIAPTPEQFAEMGFNDINDDGARKMRGVVVAELAELKGLRSSNMESVLAFITRRYEKWIPKFIEHATRFPRRLLFIATTNEQQFLDASRINRRWLPLKVKVDGDDKLLERDKKQLWAEAREKFIAHDKEGGGTGVMWEGAEELSKKERSSFTFEDAWYYTISRWLETPSSIDGKLPYDKGYITPVEVFNCALNMGVSTVRREHQHRLSEVMEVLGYETRRKRIDKVQTRAWVLKK